MTGKRSNIVCVELRSPLISCLHCKNFQGLTLDGYVHCSVLGVVKPMTICKYFEPEEEEEAGEEPREEEGIEDGVVPP